MWRAYCEATGHEGDCVVIRFGDSPGMAEELAALVLFGPKRATASLAREYGPDEPLPAVGDHVLFLGGDGTPRGIWRTTDVRVGPLTSVTDSFAHDEGEGARTRDSWLADHRAYFSRQAEAEGFAFHDGIETVFERFELVWPR
ncbi:ASCH domain-containing protein [Histidinibacterium aquaticum]|uniref:ASCH domain-containing protein n=2 Tax=Histidinibacterium aquaticum TaxID=2613962 RepID=A0A5J5GR41_9RHOB|nr:ASCH domain-containing protein [Histidinibacterium aquaticum]